MMKKVILSLAIFAATSLSMIAANDNNANASNNEKTRTECAKDKKGECPGKKGFKGDRSDNKEGKGMKAFDGLNLTDTQKTKLEELRKEFKAKKESGVKKDENRKDKKDQLTAEQKQQMKAEKQAKRQEAKQNYLNGVKSILTPEQYTQFLENNFKIAGHHHKGMKKGGKQMKGEKGQKGHKNKGDTRAQNGNTAA